jgi:hypothetical protein
MWRDVDPVPQHRRNIEEVVRMNLREQVHQSVDSLDNRSLALVYDHIQSLLKVGHGTETSQGSVPTLEEVLELTSSSPGEWSDDVSDNRDDRL